jgi:hypothetical protein
MANIKSKSKKTPINQPQYDLFGTIINQNNLEKKSQKPNIDWSYSKREVLKQCPRKYYYKYYGSKKTRSLNTPFKSELVELSYIENKYLLIGKVIHSVIATYFKKAKNGEIWAVDRLLKWANKLIDDSIQSSKKFKIVGITEFLTMQYRPILLKEIIELNINGENIKKEASEKIDTCLRNFIQSRDFQDLIVIEGFSNSMIEVVSTFSIEKNIKINVDGKIDFAFKINDAFQIIDWKTGKLEVEESSLQMLVYALWAMEKQGQKLENINIQKAYLFENKLEKLIIDNTQIERAKAMIQQDAEEMLLLDEFGKSGNYKAFDKCDESNKGKVCNQCPFQKVCIKN